MKRDSHEGSHYREKGDGRWKVVCPMCCLEVITRAEHDAADVLERHRLGLSVRQRAVW